eukprot:SAG31_NODE_8344_length_1469_cov_4.342336_1_plen_73_part_10
MLLLLLLCPLLLIMLLLLLLLILLLLLLGARQTQLLAMLVSAPELRAHQFTNGASAGLREVGSGFRILQMNIC